MADVGGRGQHGGMTGDELRELCLSQVAAEETYPFGEDTSVFKVAGKIFALSPLDADPLTVSVKADPDDAVALRAEHPGITPGYHLNKRHWITVVLDGAVPDGLVEQLVRESHALVRPRSMRP